MPDLTPRFLQRYHAWKRRRHVARLIVKQPVVFGYQRPSRIELLVYGDNVAFPKDDGAAEFEERRKEFRRHMDEIDEKIRNGARFERRKVSR